MCAPGRPQVALERSWVTLGMLWATLGRLLVDFWYQKASQKGLKVMFFLKTELFHETFEQ